MMHNDRYKIKGKNIRRGGQNRYPEYYVIDRETGKPIHKGYYCTETSAMTILISQLQKDSEKGKFLV